MLSDIEVTLRISQLDQSSCSHIGREGQQRRIECVRACMLWGDQWFLIDIVGYDGSRYDDDDGDDDDDSDDDDHGDNHVDDYDNQDDNYEDDDDNYEDDDDNYEDDDDGNDNHHHMMIRIYLVDLLHLM